MNISKLLGTIAAVSVAGMAAAPAAAQSGQYQGSYQDQRGDDRRGYDNDSNVSARIGQLQARLQAGVQSGSISRREAMPLRQQLRQLVQIERQYARNGIDGREQADLRNRLRGLRMAIRNADRNNQARWDGYDREDGYGREAYGRAETGYGGYQQPARNGIEGIVDTILGGGGLRVGQQAPRNLYDLQAGYRDQYRDGGSVYYRTDGRQIYQIDARSQTVVRIYPMNR